MAGAPRFTFALSLHLKHPSMDPEEISRALRMTPHRMTRVGEKRTSPRGRELGGAYSINHWYCTIEHAEAASLAATLEEHLGLLEPHADFLHSFTSSGGGIHYFIGWFTTDAAGGESFGWELLGRLAQLRISLWFDVYGDSGGELEK